MRTVGFLDGLRDNGSLEGWALRLDEESGRPLGEVVATDRSAALVAASQRWPEDGNLQVGSKSAVEKIRRRNQARLDQNYAQGAAASAAASQNYRRAISACLDARGYKTA